MSTKNLAMKLDDLLKCKVCGTTCCDEHIVRYVVRGLDGSRDTGRIVSKGDYLCDECGGNFENYNNNNKD